MTNLNPTSDYRPDLDGLRAIAVSTVIAFHALPHRFPGGFIGVDIFFVISGFLISKIIFTELYKNEFSISRFYVRRIKRIFPALIITLVGSWIAGWFLLEPKAFASLGANTLASAGFVSNIFLYNESGYFAATLGTNPLLYLWSLGVEEQFYIFFPLLLVYFFRTNRYFALKLWALVSISFAINVFGVTANPMASFYLPFGRSWELLIGGLLAYFYINYADYLNNFQQRAFFLNNKLRVNYVDLVSIFGVGLIAFGVWVINEQRTFPGYWALIPVAGALCIVFAGPQAWFNRHVLSRQYLVMIGLISYPLYLTHWPLLVFSSMFDVMRSNDQLRIVFAVVIAILLSLFIYIFVEKPIRFAQTVAAKKTVKPLVITLLIIMILAGTTTINGFVTRFPANVRPLLNFSYDYKENFRNSKCLLSGAEKTFSNECWQNRHLPQILIWGDSHGAMFYQALSQLAQTKGYGVAQYTSSSCPPFLNFDKKNRPLCRAFNTEIIELIAHIRPSTVVLAHDWAQSSLADMAEKLPETVEKLRSIGVNKIVLIGPVPRWTESLSLSIAKHMRAFGSEDLPMRLFDGANQRINVKGIENSLSALALILNIEYVSAHAEFCNDNGCLVWLEDPQKHTFELTAFDDSHLMPLAAKHLIGKNTHSFFSDR